MSFSGFLEHSLLLASLLTFFSSSLVSVIGAREISREKQKEIYCHGTSFQIFFILLHISKSNRKRQECGFHTGVHRDAGKAVSESPESPGCCLSVRHHSIFYLHFKNLHLKNLPVLIQNII